MADNRKPAPITSWPNKNGKPQQPALKRKNPDDGQHRDEAQRPRVDTAENRELAAYNKQLRFFRTQLVAPEGSYCCAAGLIRCFLAATSNPTTHIKECNKHEHNHSLHILNIVPNAAGNPTPVYIDRNVDRLFDDVFCPVAASNYSCLCAVQSQLTVPIPGVRPDERSE